MLYISDLLIEEKGKNYFNDYDYDLDNLKSACRSENTKYHDFYLNMDDMDNLYLSKYPTSYDMDDEEYSYEPMIEIASYVKRYNSGYYIIEGKAYYAIEVVDRKYDENMVNEILENGVYQLNDTIINFEILKHDEDNAWGTVIKITNIH